MTYFVYVLKSKKDQKLYTGFSKNPEKRLKEHNLGKTRSLFKRRPLVMIYKEEFDDELEARRREKFIKTGQGRKILKSILSKEK